MAKPTDGLGNELSEGMLVRVKLEEAAGFGRIAILKEPGVLSAISAPTAPGQTPIAMPGHIKVIIEVDIAYMPGRGGSGAALRDILVVQEPEAMKKAMREAKEAAKA